MRHIVSKTLPVAPSGNLGICSTINLPYSFPLVQRFRNPTGLFELKVVREKLCTTLKDIVVQYSTSDITNHCNLSFDNFWELFTETSSGFT